MELSVNHIGCELVEIIIEDGSVRITSSTLSEIEASEHAMNLISVAEDLLDFAGRTDLASDLEELRLK